MTNGESASGWCFAELRPVTVDQVLWHVYPTQLVDGTPIGPTQFNCCSKARLAVPGLGMYYAATTCECVLWEVPPLRSVQGDPQKRIPLHSSQFLRYRLVRVQPRRPLRLIELQGAALRHLAGDETTLSALRHAVQTHDHGSTHALAAALLEEARHQQKHVDGLLWRSKQLDADRERVILLYDPPVSMADLHCADEGMALDDGKEGWLPIDQALARGGYRRLTADASLTDD